MRDSVYDACKGRWASVLMQLGMSPTFLRNIHGPCPMCGGKDRWRWDDKNGTGTYYCNSCGAGNGIDLVMLWKSCSFVEAVKLIEGVLGMARLSVRRQHEPDVTEQKNAMRQLWAKTLELTGQDVASRYLIWRGLALKAWPAALRWARSVPYWHDKEMLGYYPVMVARIVAPDEKSANLTRTYLEEPGRKADVPTPRKMMAGPVPYGGAVRLFEAAEVMGVAEGIETALAASIIHKIPVWATLSTAGLLRFQPPPICKRLIICGDSDERFAGQAAANALAHRVMNGKNPIDAQVRIPKLESTDPEDRWVAHKVDWNDELSKAPRLRAVK